MSALPSVASGAELDEASLLTLVRDGNEEAFAVLVSRYSAMIHHLVAGFRFPRDDREELVQEGLLGLHTAAATFDASRARFSTYAYTCMYRRMCSLARRREHDVPSESVLPEVTVEDPLVPLIEREDTAALFAQLRSVLTPLEYQVLHLYLHSVSYRHIAEQLHIHPKSVDNAMQRLRRKLSRMDFTHRS